MDEEAGNTSCHDFKNFFAAAAKTPRISVVARLFGDEQYLFSTAVLTCDAGFGVNKRNIPKKLRERRFLEGFLIRRHPIDAFRRFFVLSAADLAAFKHVEREMITNILIF